MLAAGTLRILSRVGTLSLPRSPRTYLLSECFPTDELAFLLVPEEGRKWGLSW